MPCMEIAKDHKGILIMENYKNVHNSHSASQAMHTLLLP
jgi:hypothetical protein